MAFKPMKICPSHPVGERSQQNNTKTFPSHRRARIKEPDDTMCWELFGRRDLLLCGWQAWGLL